MTIKKIFLFYHHSWILTNPTENLYVGMLQMGNSFDTFDTIILNMQWAPDPPKIFSRVSK